MKQCRRFLGLVLVLVLVLSCLPFRAEAASGVPIDEAHFPDRYFRDYLVDEVYGADDWYLSSYDLGRIKSMYFIMYSDREKIQDLTGIEYFTNLTGLYCSNLSLTSLDLSKNTKLVNLECNRNQLTSLNIASCTLLQSLCCNSNQLTSLDVSIFPDLTELSCYNNQLTELDVTRNPKLTSLSCDMNQLTELDVSNCKLLESLNCRENQISSLDIRANTALTELDCSTNQLTVLDISKNLKLTELYCYENQLDSLDVRKHTELTMLYCHSNNLTKLDVSRNTALLGLVCDENQLTSLDVRKNTALAALSCSSNPLKKLDVSKNTSLGLLFCENNQLTSLDLSKNASLQQLRCGGNFLTDLDLRKNPAMTKLWCSGNLLTALDLSKHPNLQTLECGDNRLTSLNLAANTKLTKLTAAGNSRFILPDRNGQFDLSGLPGFDVTKASDWSGGTVSGTLLTPQSETVTYTYRLNDKYSETFTLTCKADGGLYRLAGSNRWETALTIADAMKADLVLEKFDSIIVACGTNFADALAGSYLATVKSVPILLSWGQGGVFAYLDEDNLSYIRSNLKEGGTVYILGSEDVVPALYEEELREFQVKRLGGDTRFDTNLRILEEAGIGEGEEILVCTATNFADSLSASATGKPVLLVFNELGSLYGDQPDFLASLKNCTFTIIGGESAVSTGLEQAIGAYGTTLRLAGSNRFETSVLVAEKFFPQAEGVVLAYAWNYPDGLCGGPLGYASRMPLILTMNGYASQAGAYVTGSEISKGFVLGSEELISDETVKTIFAIE